jgi:hypothetical protein
MPTRQMPDGELLFLVRRRVCATNNDKGNTRERDRGNTEKETSMIRYPLALVVYVMLTVCS